MESAASEDDLAVAESAGKGAGAGAAAAAGAKAAAGAAAAGAAGAKGINILKFLIQILTKLMAQEPQLRELKRRERRVEQPAQRPPRRAAKREPRLELPPLLALSSLRLARKANSVKHLAPDTTINSVPSRPLV